ncbi:hypothetical protein WJX74_003920 [Apatococcus lobatus]|uniref:Uncharacterized protein n=1 Tax=Apatococcus lobatus TaxID=904363 RepID=A0AAW1QKY9_9CHLO
MVSETTCSPPTAQLDDLKRNAAVELKESHFAAAIQLYLKAYEDYQDVGSLSNASLAAFRSGDPRKAVEYADLAFRRFKAQDSPPELQAKALYRKGSALLAGGQPEFAVPTLQRALKTSGGSTSISAGLLQALSKVSQEWLVKHWTTLITDAEKPAALSSRDGRLLRRPPMPAKLEQGQLMEALQQAFTKSLQQHARDLLVEAQGQRPGRGPLSLLRGYAYLAAGNAEQAVKAAQAYGPSAEGASSWPEAWALLARSLEQLEDYTAAGLAAAQAQELRKGSLEYQEDVQRITCRMPRLHADALEEGGVAALKHKLAAEAEEAKPEFLKQRPKYYYYYRWMTERITEHCTQLPAPVMDKLLTMDAGELDLLLQHESAIKAKAQHLEDVLQDKGAKYLETYKVPMLTWEEVKALKGPGLVGLGPPGGEPVGLSTGPAGPNMLEGIPEQEFELLEGHSPHKLKQKLEEVSGMSNANSPEGQTFEDLEALE